MKQLMLFIAICFFALSAASQDQSQFDEANSLYNDGNYAEALDLYQSVLETGRHSAALYFNMANCHYKLNHIAPSIYYYEKALLLNPSDKDVKNNLDFARNMTIDDIDTVPDVGFSKLAKTVTNTMSYDGWARTSVFLVLLFVAFLIFYFFSEKTSFKRFAFVTGASCFVLGMVALSLAFHKEKLVLNDQPAIVFAEESQIKNEPNLRSDESFTLHEGTKVEVLDTVDDWKKIKLIDGKTGWVISDDVKLLKNF